MVSIVVLLYPSSQLNTHDTFLAWPDLIYLFCYVAQAVLELMGLSDPPASIFNLLYIWDYRPAALFEVI